MKVFKTYLKITSKYKTILLLYMVIFTAMTIIFSRDGSSNIRLIKLRVGVNDKSKSETSKFLIDYLKRNHQVKIDDFTESQAKKDIFIGKYHIALIIDKNFENNLIEKKKTITFLSNPASPSSVLIRNEVNKFLVYSNASVKNGKIDVNKIVEAIKNSNVEIKFTKNASIKNSDFWLLNYYRPAAYVSFVMVLSVISLSMNALLKENVAKRFEVSSMSNLNFLIQTTLGQLLVSLIMIIPIILLPAIFIGNKYFESAFPYAMNLILLSMSGIGLGNLIITFTNKSPVISSINNISSLGLGFLSGVMVPREFLGDSLISFSKLFPYYYYLNICDLIYDKKFSFDNAKYDILVLLLFPTVTLILSIWLKKKIKNRNI